MIHKYLKRISNSDKKKINDSKTKEQIRLISLKNTMNTAILSEGEQMEDNFNAAKNMNFPKELPVLFFLA